MVEVSQKALDVIATLKAGPKEGMLAGEIAEKLGVAAASVNATVTNLAKKGFAMRSEPVVSESTNEAGKKIVHSIRYIALTDSGKGESFILKVDAPKKPRKSKTEA